MTPEQLDKLKELAERAIGGMIVEYTEFQRAVSPDVVLKLIAEVERLQDADYGEQALILMKERDVLRAENEKLIAEVKRINKIEEVSAYEAMRNKAYNEQFLKDKDEKESLRAQLDEAREVIEHYSEAECVREFDRSDLGETAREYLEKYKG